MTGPGKDRWLSGSTLRHAALASRQGAAGGGHAHTETHVPCGTESRISSQTCRPPGSGSATWAGAALPQLGCSGPQGPQRTRGLRHCSLQVSVGRTAGFLLPHFPVLFTVSDLFREDLPEESALFCLEEHLLLGSPGSEPGSAPTSLHAHPLGTGRVNKCPRVPEEERGLQISLLLRKFGTFCSRQCTAHTSLRKGTWSEGPAGSATDTHLSRPCLTFTDSGTNSYQQCD